jgi:hypothetical protein
MTGENATAPVPAAETTRGRRFGVYDLMILIAGIALLLTYNAHNILSLLQQLTALCKTIAAYYGFISAKPYGPPQFLMRTMATYWSTVLWYVVQSSEQTILIITPVFLLMRMRRPRPPIRVLLTQPGTVAGLAVPLGLIWVTGWLHRLFFGRIIDGTVTAIAVGGTVALAWTCLACSPSACSGSGREPSQKDVHRNIPFPCGQWFKLFYFRRVRVAIRTVRQPSVRSSPRAPGHARDRARNDALLR